MGNIEYDRIVNCYADMVYRVALSYAKSIYDAEDVVQTTFMKLLLNEEHFNDEEHIRKWLIRVAINECNNIWSSYWRKNVDLKDDISHNTSFTSEDKSELYYAVMDLPSKYRIVIYLFYYEGYSTGDIAGLLHVNETAVRTRLTRGRRKLKEKLGEVWRDE